MIRRRVCTTSDPEQDQRAKQLIREYFAAHKSLDYMDAFTPMLGADGKPRQELYVVDRLHRTAVGYKLWTQLVRPHLP